MFSEPATMDVVKTTGQKRKPTGWVEFGMRLRGLREARGLSRENIAHSTSIDAVSLYRIEKGEQWVSPKALQELASELRVDVPDLFGKKPPAQTDHSIRDLLAALATLNDLQIRRCIDFARSQLAAANGSLPLEDTDTILHEVQSNKRVRKKL